MKKFIFTFVLVLAALSASAQYRVDRLVTAGRSALFYEDFVLSIKYFNLAIGAKPYLYEPWYYRSVAKFNLDDYMGAESDASEAINLNPYINDIYDLRAICRIRQQRYDDAIADYNSAIDWSLATATTGSTVRSARWRRRTTTRRSWNWIRSSPSGRIIRMPTP